MKLDWIWKKIGEAEIDANETDGDKILEELFFELLVLNTEREEQNQSRPTEEFGHVTVAMLHEQINILIRRAENAGKQLTRSKNQ